MHQDIERVLISEQELAARIVITRGFYAEAKNIMQKIEPKEEDPLDYLRNRRAIRGWLS